MFLLARPKYAEIEAYLAAAESTTFSYLDIGATQTHPPDGYVVDHNRVQIGRGFEDWDRAKHAVRKWKMFDLGWAELLFTDTPIEKDRIVAILVNHFGFYSLNAARIVFTINERSRFGFAYGTLTDHVESGEERFMVEINERTGEVWYDLFAFSRPNHLLAKLGYPLTRRLQRQFASDSKSAMLRSMEIIR
ncbi:MAG: DUF1990 domain-containing protein [Blastocatellia bacterium]|nr:DUF1990 domain-containing protein [Chloracidobacterium sp.]MBL8185228.1 DUF1990 domain-containing protein [Blastocatellia bacterium]HBE81480.1 DUF1990 domain-containing protein [Blastocatellia bacterium]HRJ88106.1 DUF1990 domain-containing protein [Pyrinomonadaceae bacterium]HRK51802.1 DUF1990 domain-containing protein [Pyrinomonadaceae bacterium]